MMQNRDVTIDVMKGIAILAMIAGHCFIPLRLLHFIYMWHIPLFFFVSGYFFKDKPLGKTVSGIWRGVLVPYLVVAAFILLCTICSDSLWGTDLLKSKGIALFAVNGLLADPDAYGGAYKCGPIWFLLALGWCKVAYGILAKLRLNVIVETLCLGVLSYLIVRYHDGLYMPFFMLQAFASLVFYHAGYLFKRNMAAIGKHRRMAVVLGVTALAVGMWRGSMDIWALWFSNWTLNTCAAIGSIVSLYFVISSRNTAPPLHTITLWRMASVIR